MSYKVRDPDNPQQWKIIKTVYCDKVATMIPTRFHDSFDWKVY